MTDISNVINFVAETGITAPSKVAKATKIDSYSAKQILKLLK